MNIPQTEFEIVTDAICGIANALAIHQVVDEEKLYPALTGRNPNLTKELYNQSLEICDKLAVITGRANGKIYQTSSLQNKMTKEAMHEFITGL